MRKTLVAVVALLLISPLLKAQDTILKTDQTEVSAKVIEITTDEVKFKYVNRLEGPTYTLKKAEVFVIIYQDGTREKFSATATTPNMAVAPSAYTETPALRPDKPTPTPAAYSAPAATEAKYTGWTFGFGYTSPARAFGEAHGLTISSGLYFLGSGRKAGGMLDLDGLYFFGDAARQYYLLSVNGIFRTSNTSRFYFGGGVGYASVAAEVISYDRFNTRRTTTVTASDFGGKAFMGYGAFRASMIWPSYQSSNGLFTIGFYSNPF